MGLHWKLIGLAGLAGVGATGAVVARRRRAQREFRPDELRDRLHRRLAAVEPPAARGGGDPASSPQAPGSP